MSATWRDDWTARRRSVLPRVAVVASLLGIAITSVVTLVAHADDAAKANTPNRPAKVNQPDEPKKQGENAREGKRTPRPLPVFTPAREAAALAFVTQNHAELKRVLKTLSESDETAYRSAIRHIFADSERLAELQSSDQELHAISLEQWRLKSRIDLLVARMQSGGTPDPGDQRTLKNHLKRQVELELSRTRLEIRRVEQRLENRKRDLDERERSIEKIVNRRLQRIASTIPAMASPKTDAGDKETNESPAPETSSKQSATDAPSKN